MFSGSVSVIVVLFRAVSVVDVRVSPATVAIPALTAGPAQTTLLAVHRRATRRGSWIIDPR
ncbi:MAG: hypothetical protein M3319_10750, partial [Actinomycetota bacterium]|nr:hypothetical protein [Actinomycetota bacterium]